MFYLGVNLVLICFHRLQGSIVALVCTSCVSVVRLVSLQHRPSSAKLHSRGVFETDSSG